jgi:hypothetical protein
MTYIIKAAFIGGLAGILINTSSQWYFRVRKGKNFSWAYFWWETIGWAFIGVIFYMFR